MQDTYQDYEEFYPKNSKKDELYDWVFHYNHVEDLWNAVPRESYNEYFNGLSCDLVKKSKSLETLVDLILDNNKNVLY